MRLLGVSAVFVLAVSLMSDDPGLQIAAPLFGLLTVVQLYPLLRRGAVDLFEPPVQTGLYAAFTTVATVVAFSQDGSLSLRFLEHLSNDQTLALVVQTVLCSILGLVSYYVGYYHPRWGQKAALLLPDLWRPRWIPWRLHVAAAILLGIFGATYFFFQGGLGVELTDATQLAEGKAVWRGDPTSSWMLRGIELGFLAALLYMALYAKQRRWLRLAAAVALLLACSFLVSRTGQRGAYVAALLLGLGLLHYLVRRVPVVAFVALMLAATALSNVQLQWRTGPPSQRPAAREVVQGLSRPMESLSAHEEERQRFATLALVFHVFPDSLDHLLGETYVGLVATFVPRWLWPEKAEHFQWRDTMIIPRLVGAPIPSSYLAILWVNWSYPGIVFGMVLWGVIHRMLYEGLRRRTGDPATVLVFLTTSTTLSLSLHGVSSAVEYALPAIACVVFVGGLRRPSNATSPLASSKVAALEVRT